MNALILLLFAADPTGLEAAFESAETVDVSFVWTGFKVTLVNKDTIRALPVGVRGQGIKSTGKPATPEVLRVAIHGKKTTEFWMTESNIGVGDMRFHTDDRLWLALRSHFEPKEGLPERPKLAESVQKTLTAAMKGAERLDVTYRDVTIKFPASPDGIRNVHLSNLKLAGEPSYKQKKPEDTVEVVFVTKETRIPIYLSGDTAYWGDQWSVRLTRDSMWSQMVGSVPPKEVRKPSVKANDPSWQPDAPYLKESIEGASEVKISFGKDTISLKGDGLKEIAKLVKSDGKAVEAVTGRDGKEFLHIQIADEHYRLFSDDVLCNGESAATVVGIKLDHDLWGTLRSRFKPPEKPVKK